MLIAYIIIKQIIVIWLFAHLMVENIGNNSHIINSGNTH